MRRISVLVLVLALLSAGVLAGASVAVQRQGSHVTVQVGSTIHPMLEEHYIQLIAAVSGNKVTFQLPKPGDEPVLKAGGADPVTAYEYCNLHGFWKAQE